MFNANDYRIFILNQSYGLIIEEDIFKPAYDFTINPHKRTGDEEDNMKVQFQHLELAMLIYLIVLVSVVIPSLLMEITKAYVIDIWYCKYKIWDYKWKMRHGLW